MSEKGLIRRFFGFIYRFMVRLIKVVQVLVFLVVFGIVVSALSNLSGDGLTVPDSAALVVAPVGMLVNRLKVNRWTGL